MRHRSNVFIDPIDPGFLTDLTATRDVAEGIDRQVRLDMTHSADDRRGVNATGKSRTDGYVTTQMQTNAGEELLADFLGSIGKAKVMALVDCRAPPTHRLTKATCTKVHTHDVTWWQMRNTIEKGLCTTVVIAMYKIVVRALPVQLYLFLLQRLDRRELRRKKKAPLFLRIEERLDTERVAYASERTGITVKNHEGEHTHQP